MYVFVLLVLAIVLTSRVSEISKIQLSDHKHTVNSTVLGHRQFRVNFRKKYLFSPNGIVFRYYDYPVIFSNLLAT